MSLENFYFKKDYPYRVEFINRCIEIIRFSEDEKRCAAYKNLVFRMMNKIVKKNIGNYLNLTRAVYNKNLIPSNDELIAECYLVFDKCLERYIIDPNNNFYFYYNKSLSRNFYREYQRLLKTNKNVEITDYLIHNEKNLHSDAEADLNAIKHVIENLGFNDVEKRICFSKVEGQKTAVFLEQNKDITNVQYNKGLKRVKEVLSFYHKKGEI